MHSTATRWLCGGIVALTLSVTPAAHADTLTADESAQLARGDTVVRTQTIERGDSRWVGGVTYTVLDASEKDMDAVLDDVASWHRILPRTKSAVKVGEKDGDVLVELRQGSALFETSYTIRVRKDPAARTVRFWMDPTRPHGIDDAWGFFRVEPMESGRVLFTFGVLLDLGDGLGRALFEERIRSATLAVPQRVRQHLAALHARRSQRMTMR